MIDTITSKIVLILGRFTDDSRAVLEGIREELRKRDYLPVLFDFEKPSSRNLTETVRTLALLACFVTADVTDARSIPQELMAIVPNLPSLPVQPLLLASQHKYGCSKTSEATRGCSRSSCIGTRRHSWLGWRRR